VVAGGQPDNGFRGVALFALDEFIAGRSAEGMVVTAFEVVLRLDAVFLFQTWRDGLRHRASGPLRRR
jgi:hypothetical protein